MTQGRLKWQPLSLWAALLLMVLLTTRHSLGQAPAPPVPDIPPAQPIPLGFGITLDGALDVRYRTSDTGRHNTIWLNTLETDFTHSITVKGRSVGRVYIQGLVENPADITGKTEAALGEAYVIYQLPLPSDTDSTAFIKVGQFQLPFALLATYDPHLRLVQPLYAEALGVRTDWGIAASGSLYGLLNYDFAVTAGSGPDHADLDPNRVVTFRLGRTFYTRNGIVTVGGSLLTGRLPVTDLDRDDPFAVELPPSGRVRPYRDGGTVKKSRIAADGTISFKSAMARGEIIGGADGDQRILGYYLEGDYTFTPRTTVLLAYSYYQYPLGDSSDNRSDLGLSYRLGPQINLNLLYQYLEDVPRDTGGQVRHRFTLQALYRF